MDLALLLVPGGLTQTFLLGTLPHSLEVRGWDPPSQPGLAPFPLRVGAEGPCKEGPCPKPARLRAALTFPCILPAPGITAPFGAQDHPSRHIVRRRSEAAAVNQAQPKGTGSSAEVGARWQSSDPYGICAGACTALPSMDRVCFCSMCMCLSSPVTTGFLPRQEGLTGPDQHA